MHTLAARVSRYATLAAALPAASASGAIVWSGPGPLGVATVNNPLLLDLGAGIGEVFRFEVGFDSAVGATFSATSYTFNGYTYFRPGGSFSFQSWNPLIQFNPANGNGIGDPRFAFAGTGNDPLRLASGVLIPGIQSFYGPMTTSFGTSHDLGISSTFQIRYTTGFADSGGFETGQWGGGARGFIGFNIEVAGADTFGWIDVEWNELSKQLIIHGWAYNDTPRGPISTGEVPAPASGLALLALGAAGIRRKRAA